MICLKSDEPMTTTVQCNIGCHWVDAGVQCDLGYPGYPISTSTPYSSHLLSLNQIYLNVRVTYLVGHIVYLKRVAANCKFKY